MTAMVANGDDDLMPIKLIADDLHKEDYESEYEITATMRML